MSIVFEEITASVAPEAGATPEGPPAAPDAPESAEERADALRHALALRAERALRLRAD